MKRAILVLGLLLLGLLGWERALVRGAALRRADRTRVGWILPQALRNTLPVAALRIEIPGEPTHLYARVGGRWAALSYQRAAADDNAVAKLIASVAEAQGSVVSEDPAAAATFGLAGSEAIVVSLCGPKVLEDPSGDVLESFEVGRSLGERGASFVRRRGFPAIWNVESDARSLLAPRVAPGLPPLLDPAAIPGAWSGWTKGLDTIFVDYADGRSLQLVRRLRDPELDPPAQGEPPWRWHVATESAPEFASAPAPARGFELFLARIPYVDVLAPSEARALGLDRPTAKLTLAAPDEEPLVVLLGAPLPDGRVPLLVPSSNRLVLLPAEVARLVTPSVDWFRPEAPQNPWDPYLRQTTPGVRPR